MKMRVKSLVLIVAGAALLGCGGDPPTADLNAAKQALDAAGAAGAERFASSEYSAAQSAYNQAESTVNTEAEKLFKNFDQAKSQIADAKSKADRAQSSATSEKGRQKGSAEGVIAAAQAAVAAARASLDEAPVGKGTEADIEQLRADLSGADAGINAARSDVGNVNFADAETKAKSAEQAAGQVASGVQMAVQKYQDLVEKMRPWYDRI